eukprot:gnl/Hemi2/8227_TR2833_c0_g1_i1.p1 gnl/Hemi2/8227_TR2833_c0_g1~~gnl/Hemi2/8227_TR2833_c0_g1_i1.p1  ORF type:complete len:472 (+),score=64.33 gnl/Hemi2/8227_TR2833_c0_g1_i1:113-1417(+)
MAGLYPVGLCACGACRMSDGSLCGPDPCATPGAVAHTMQALLVPAPPATAAAPPDALYWVQLDVPCSLTRFGVRKELFRLAALHGALSPEPKRLVHYEGTSQDATCKAWFHSRSDADRFLGAVTDTLVAWNVSVTCSQKNRAQLQLVQLADFVPVVPNAHYDKALYNSPPGSITAATDPGAKQNAPEIQRACSFGLQQVHIIPKAFKRFINCILWATNNFNACTDGDICDGIPRCYMVMEAVPPALLIVFMDHDCRAEHPFVPGADTGATHNGYPAVRIVLQTPLANFEEYAAACELRTQLVLPWWQAKVRDPGLRLKRGTWACRELASKLSAGDSDIPAHLLDLFQALVCGDWLYVHWRKHGKAEVKRSHGQIVNVIHRDHHNRNLILLLRYPLEKGNATPGDCLYPLPYVRAVIRLLERAPALPDPADMKFD